MSAQEYGRRYADGKLQGFVDELDEGERKLLILAGALPAEPFQKIDPRLTSKDTARMIELARES